MIYDDLFYKYIKYVEIDESEFIDYIKENNIDETDGTHIWFGLVVTPYLIDAIRNSKKNIIIKSFEFIEKNLDTDDVDITEVIEFSLLEGLVSELKDELKFIEEYIGPKTRTSILNIHNYIL